MHARAWGGRQPWREGRWARLCVRRAGGRRQAPGVRQPGARSEEPVALCQKSARRAFFHLQGASPIRRHSFSRRSTTLRDRPDTFLCRHLPTPTSLRLLRTAVAARDRASCEPARAAARSFTRHSRLFPNYPSPFPIYAHNLRRLRAAHLHSQHVSPVLYFLSLHYCKRRLQRSWILAHCSKVSGIDARFRRAFVPKPMGEFVERCGVAMRLSTHSALLRVFTPSREPQTCSFRLGVLAEEYSLNLTFDVEAHHLTRSQPWRPRRRHAAEAGRQREQPAHRGW